MKSVKTTGVALVLLGAVGLSVPNLARAVEGIDCEGCAATALGGSTDTTNCPGTAWFVTASMVLTSGTCVPDETDDYCVGSPCDASVTYSWKLPDMTPVTLGHSYGGNNHTLNPAPVANGQNQSSGPHSIPMRCNNLQHSFNITGSAGGCGAIQAHVDARCSDCVEV